MSQDVVLCNQCDAVHRWRPLAPHEMARCSRCGAVLARGHRLGVNHLLALTIAAGVVLLIGVFMPMMTLDLRGFQSNATLPEAIAATWDRGERLVAVAAAFTAIVAPAAFISLRLVILWPMAHGRRPDHLAWCMRVLHEASRWSMVEVLTVSAVVSVVRLAAMAPSLPGPGMAAFAVLPLLMAALQAGGLRHLWQEME
ncbi:MAG TPA: paraquat-inducible protein A [Albitalea sp.]